MGEPIDIVGHEDHIEFSLTNGRSPEKNELRILIDNVDFDDLVRGTTGWYIHIGRKGNAYVRYSNNRTKRNSHLHREIWINSGQEIPEFTGAFDGLVLDHVNRNSLDNRRENIRAITARDNIRNSDLMEARQYSERRYRGFAVVKVKAPQTKGGWFYQSYDGRKYIGGSIDIGKAEEKIDNYLGSPPRPETKE